MQRPITQRFARRRAFAGVALLGLAIAGFAGAAGAESGPVVVPTASGYFLSEPTAPVSRNPVAATTLGGPERPAATGYRSNRGCRSGAAENPLCQLRWTTGRTRGSDIRARYYEMTDDVKARIVGNSRAEYFDLDLDTSPEFKFKLRF